MSESLKPLLERVVTLLEEQLALSKGMRVEMDKRWEQTLRDFPSPHRTDTESESESLPKPKVN